RRALSVCLLNVKREDRVGRIPDHGEPREAWHRLLEKLQTFPFRLRSQGGKPRDVPARSCEAGDEPGPNRITGCRHNDWYRLGRFHGRKGAWRATRHDHIRVEAD